MLLKPSRCCGGWASSKAWSASCHDVFGLFKAVVKQHLALVDDDDPQAQLFHVLQVVAREYDGDAVFAIYVKEEIADTFLDHDVQADCRLVEMDYREPM